MTYWDIATILMLLVIFIMAVSAARDYIKGDNNEL